VLQLQTEIATAVAIALKVALLGDVAAKIEAGGTRNVAAIDAYLRATKAYADRRNAHDVESAIGNYTKALELDPDYALAYAGRSIALSEFALNFAPSHDVRATVDKAEGDARKAIALAPDLGLGHLALAGAVETGLEFGPASEEFERANALEPGSARILTDYGNFAVCMGKQDAGLGALRRAVTLDPLNVGAHSNLGLALILSRRYKEALEVLKTAETVNPENPTVVADIGVAEYLLGDFKGALKSCEKRNNDVASQLCLALTYDKLGRHADAQAMFTTMRASRGDAGAVFYTWVLAQWGQTNRALDSLETALRVRSPYLEQLKTAELFDPLRKEPRFQAIERELKFPK
jgi:serine/threonine-protein kinase